MNIQSNQIGETQNWLLVNVVSERTIRNVSIGVARLFGSREFCTTPWQVWHPLIEALVAFLQSRKTWTTLIMR
jgi:hypothetical protein